MHNQKEQTPKRLSMTDIISTNDNWNLYSHFHDHFLELLAYENQRSSDSDIWRLNYI